MSAQQGIRLDSLDPQDLMGLKERLEGDLERFSNSANVLLRTSHTFDQAGSSISSLAKSKEGRLSKGALSIGTTSSGDAGSESHSCREPHGFIHHPSDPHQAISANTFPLAAFLCQV